MSAGTTIQTENLNFFFDGEVSANLQKPSTNLGDLNYYFDGEVYVNIYPQNIINNLNGGFFLFMGF